MGFWRAVPQGAALFYGVWVKKEEPSGKMVCRYFSRMAQKPIYFTTFGSAHTPPCRCPAMGRGKSGQHRAPLFLTGRGQSRKGMPTASAAERDTAGACAGKGEKVG